MGTLINTDHSQAQRVNPDPRGLKVEFILSGLDTSNRLVWEKRLEDARGTDAWYSIWSIIEASKDTEKIEPLVLEQAITLIDQRWRKNIIFETIQVFASINNLADQGFSQTNPTTYVRTWENGPYRAAIYFASSTTSNPSEIEFRGVMGSNKTPASIRIDVSQLVEIEVELSLIQHWFFCNAPGFKNEQP